MAERKLRVLFVGAFPSPDRMIFGGMVTACRALIQSSFVERFDIDAFDSTQISIPFPPLPVRLLLALKRTVLFVARFERRKPDAVLVFVAPGASVLEKSLFAWYSRLRGVPSLIFPRGGALIDECRNCIIVRWYTKAGFNAASKMLCQGPKWQEFAVEVLGFDRQDAPIIPNWTASDILLSIGSARDETVHVSTTRLLFLGWLGREKGIFELLEACARLSSSRRFELRIVGEGNASGEARVFAEERGLNSVVSFLGWLQGERLAQVFTASDVLVLPSWVEGLPNAIVEAMAAKLAVVATCVGNVPDVITDGVSGLLVRPRDVDALTRALGRLIDDPVLRSSLASAGHTIAKARFASGPAIDRLVEAISDTVSAAQTGRLHGGAH